MHLGFMTNLMCYLVLLTGYNGITMGKDVEWECNDFTSNLTSILGHQKLLDKANRQTLDMLQQEKMLMKLDETHPN